MKMKRCVLHIGCEKTASTYIQGALYSNLYPLRRQGYHIFHSLAITNNRTFPAYFEPFVVGGFNEWQHANGCLTPKDKEDFFYGFEDAFHDEVMEAAQYKHTAIITSEHFHSRIKTRNQMQEIKDFLSRSFDKIEIVCYFRDPVETAVAAWSTIIKIGWHASLDFFLSSKCTPDNYYYNHMHIADKWAAVFGRENCHFHLYDQRRDAFEHFISLIGIRDAPERQSSHANVSLTSLQAEAYRIINKKLPFMSVSGGGSRCMKNRKARAQIIASGIYDYGNIRSDLEPELRERFKVPSRLFLEKYFPGVKDYPRKVSKVPEPTAEQYKIAYENFLETFLFTKIMDNVEKINVNLLRDVAFNIRSDHPEYARKLLRHALEFRPGAKVLEKALSEWVVEDREKEKPPE